MTAVIAVEFRPDWAGKKCVVLGNENDAAEVFGTFRHPFAANHEGLAYAGVREDFSPSVGTLTVPGVLRVEMFGTLKVPVQVALAVERGD